MAAEYESHNERRDSNSSSNMSDAELPFIPKESSFISGPRRRSRPVTCGQNVLQKPGLLIAANLVLFAFSLGSSWMAWSHEDAANKNLKTVSWPSALLDMVDLQLSPRYGHAEPSEGGNLIWYQPPSPEVDKAWERVTKGSIVAVHKSEFTKMSKDPAKHVALPEKYWVDGEVTYMAKWSALHNLHCLDSIRKSLFPQYYYPNGTIDKPLAQPDHLRHCVMVLFEALTCTPDMTLHPFRWKEFLDEPVPRTNMWHQCVNFDSILDQYEAFALQDFTAHTMEKLAGVYEWSLSEEEWDGLAEYAQARQDAGLTNTPAGLELLFDEVKKRFPSTPVKT